MKDQRAMGAISSKKPLTILVMASLCFSRRRTASSTAISSKGFMLNLTFWSTPLPSEATRILTAICSPEQEAKSAIVNVCEQRFGRFKVDRLTTGYNTHHSRWSS